MSILIKNGRLWDGENAFLSDVFIDGSEIAEISPEITRNADFVYNAEGQAVSAGLVDIHVHMQGISTDAFGIQTEMSCLPFGVTAACDAGGIKGNRERLESFAVKSNAFAAVDVKNNHIEKSSAEARIALYGDKCRGLKLYFDTESPDVKDATPLCELCEYAESKGLKVMVHSSNSPVPMSSFLKYMRRGDILTHAYHGGANNSSEDNFECLKAAKKRGIIVDIGFAGHVHTDFEVLRCGIENGAAPDTISTDITRCSAYKRGGIYGMTMCMSIAKHLGMCEKDIFRAVTSSAAKAVGKENESGTLKVGKIADIAVLDENGCGFSLTDKAGHHIASSSGYRCVLTVVNGEIVYRA